MSNELAPLPARNLADGDLSQAIQQPFIPTLDKLRDRLHSASAARLKRCDGNGHCRGTRTRSQPLQGRDIRTASDDLAKRTEHAGRIRRADRVRRPWRSRRPCQGFGATRIRCEAGQLVLRATSRSAQQSAGVVRAASRRRCPRSSNSSRQIANIVGVIDDIAFQTNLLALNAGVEAARAGEAGKGFAVVAQEVRELAQRSAGAAKEIKALIRDSESSVRDGVALVGKTGSALEAIAAQVLQVHDNVSGIVEAAKEQSSSLNQINGAVMSMDQDTQRNAAMVEQTAAASRRLALEAEALFELVGQFKVGGVEDVRGAVGLAKVA
jgi:methyl-accepting chemotaxis protein